jgi:hypothetical protein
MISQTPRYYTTLYKPHNQSPLCIGINERGLKHVHHYQRLLNASTFFKIILACQNCVQIFLCQKLNTATSLPADDVHNYIIPQKLLDAIFNKRPVFMHQWERQKAVLYLVEVLPALIADSLYVATMARKHSVLNLLEINTNNMHTALTSVLTYYGQVSLIFYFPCCDAEKYYLKI